MSRLVQVPSAAIRSRLAGAGFTLVQATHGKEVYERAHNRDARYVVRVHGGDPIRVVALFMEMVPIFSATCVLRMTVDAVLDMVIELAGEAYAECNAHRRKGAA